jgi:hypothetical protein
VGSLAAAARAPDLAGLIVYALIKNSRAAFEREESR